MGRVFLAVLAAAVLVSGCTSDGSAPSGDAASDVEQSPSSQPTGAVVKGDLVGWPLDTVDCAEAFRVATYDGPVVEVDSGDVTSLMVCRSGDLLAPLTLTPDNPAWGRVLSALAAPPRTRGGRVCIAQLPSNLRSLGLIAVTGQGAFVVEVAEDACGLAAVEIVRAFREAGVPFVGLVVP